MPMYDPPKDGDVIPAGTYRCKLSDVRDKDRDGNKLKAKSGHEMFNLRLTVTDGEYEGAIIYDRIVFGGKGQNRVKILLKALGFDIDKPMDVTTDTLQDASIKADIIIGSYEGKEKNEVKFDGYHADDTPASAF